MKTIILPLVFICSLSFSQTVSQTDWSGAGKILGPVSDWENNYFFLDNIEASDGALHFSSQRLPELELHPIDSNMDAPYSIQAADIDNDGDYDVVAADHIDDLIAWWENTDGLGTSWTKHIISDDFDGASTVFFVDFNNDGCIDVLGTSDIAGEIFWWENLDGLGLSWEEHPIDDSSPGISTVCAVDIDGDSDFDVVGAAALEGSLSWWENLDGSALSWLEHITYDQYPGGSSVCANDVNNDGNTDILASSSILGTLDWWENSDTTPGVFISKHTVETGFTRAISIQSADIDGDGYLDILGAAYGQGDICWWRNVLGTGKSWTKFIVAGDLTCVRTVYAADIDSDGDLDILAASSLKGIFWWENLDGLGTSWTKHTIDEGLNGTRSVCVADIDNDTYPDILGTRMHKDDISWWALVGFIPPGVLLSSILDLEQDVGWGNFSAVYEEPSSTTVGFQFRSSDNYSNMGPWSDTVFTSNISLVGLLADSTRYLQYRICLDTENSFTPEVHEVVFSFLQLGIEENGIDSFSLTVLNNPCNGLFSVDVDVPEDITVELFVYDAYGRVVAYVNEALPVGTHSVSFTGLSQGVYFCRMFAGSFTATERVVFLR